MPVIREELLVVVPHQNVLTGVVDNILCVPAGSLPVQEVAWVSLSLVIADALGPIVIYGAARQPRIRINAPPVTHTVDTHRDAACINTSVNTPAPRLGPNAEGSKAT